jgi:Tfp pilus assembly protein PilF
MRMRKEESMLHRTTVRTALLGAMAAALFAVAGHAQQPNPSAAPLDSTQQAQATVAQEQAVRKAYSEMVSQTYNYRFGVDHPSLPGRAAAEGQGFLEPGAFPKAEYCAHCHQEAYSQWRQALHSNAFRTPFYRTSVNILINTRGIEFARHCDSCHNPVAVLAGGLTQDSQVDRSFDRDGLTCMTCHSIQSVQSTNGNGGIVMGVPAVMVDEHGNRIPGEVPYDEIMKHTDRHVAAVMRPLLHQPEFCASCHKANLPHELNDYKFLRAFTTYDEWQNSKFSKRNPLTFYSADFTTCQGCHMKRNPNVLPDYGAKNGTFASHRWLAGNTAVPFYYGFDEQLQKTIDFLKSGNFLNVDIMGLKKAGDNRLIAPLGSVPFTLEPNSVVETYVVVQNKNIGHSLIPEVRDLYEAWTEFTVKDADGNEIYHSGYLQPDGSLDPVAHSFTNRPVNVDNGFVDNHKVWTIHSVAFDNTVPAGRSVLIRYQFRIPENAKGPISITARVNYRHFRQSYLNNVFGKDHPAYPVVEITSRTRTVNLGQNEPTPPDPQDNADWMRWNNLGIALLDQFQYPESVDAFTQVVKLRPDYADGYTNISLTEAEWEKFDSAKMNIDKALALSPNNARALYYSALLERRFGRPDTEVAELEEVVRQYPDSRDARRELGISYYQQHRYDDAMHQFEALQKIDPDDLAAHYNLSILYRRMGMKKQAAEQQAAFVDKKFDPGSPVLALEFLKQHPELSEENIPWHLHTNLPEQQAAKPPANGAPAEGRGEGQY